MEGVFDQNPYEYEEYSSESESSTTQDLTVKIKTSPELLIHLDKSIDFEILSVENLSATILERLSGHSSQNIKKLFKETKNINFQDKDGNTLLHNAIRNRVEVIANVLVTFKGIDLSIINYSGKSILHLASEAGYTLMVQLIVSKNILDVNQQDYLKYTPLHYALLNRHDDVAMILLDANADLKLETYQKESGYYLALAKNCADVIQKFENTEDLKSLPVENMITVYGNTILHHINTGHHLNKVWSPNFELIKNKVNCRGESALHYAVKKNNLNLVEYLIKKNISLDFKGLSKENRIGEDIFQMAIRKKQNTFLRAHLPKFYENSTNKFFLNYFESALIYGNWHAADLIRDHRNISWDYRNKITKSFVQHYAAAGVHQKDDDKYIDPMSHNFFRENIYGMYPCLYLILYNKYKMLECLFQNSQVKEKYSYWVNSKSKDNALHYAVRSRNPEMIDLIASGLPNFIDAQNKNQMTPLKLAVLQNDPAIVDILLKKCKEFNKDVSCSPLLMTCIENNEEPNLSVLSLLCDGSCNVNYRTYCGSCPLYLAVDGQKESVVKFLLSRGATPSVWINKDTNIISREFREIMNMTLENQSSEMDPDMSYNESVLHVAVSKPNTEITLSLLKYCTFFTVINAYNSIGLTPLHCAIMCNQYKQASILLKYGADVNFSVMATKDTCLHLALRVNCMKLIKKLLLYNCLRLPNAKGVFPDAEALLFENHDIRTVFIQYQLSLQKEKSANTNQHPPPLASSSPEISFSN